jgi:hypothetical protein
LQDINNIQNLSTHQKKHKQALTVNVGSARILINFVTLLPEVYNISHLKISLRFILASK